MANELGLPGLDEPLSFNLANGAQFFPTPPAVHIVPGGFRFPAAPPAVRYMASGPLWDHMGDAANDPAMRSRALESLGSRIDAVISRKGTFDVHSEMGFFLAVKE